MRERERERERKRKRERDRESERERERERKGKKEREISILLKETRVCVCVCKIGPISACTLLFRHQTSRTLFHIATFQSSTFGRPLFAFVLCVLRQKIIKKPKMLGKRIDRRNC